MRKLKNVDAFGYKAQEFEDCLKGTTKRMLKRAQERESNQEMQAVFAASRQNARKFRRQAGEMEAE